MWTLTTTMGHTTYACALKRCTEWAGLSSWHAACVWVYTASKVLPSSLSAPGGLRAGLTTADLPAPLQEKISYQAAAALSPAVWGLCQGFLHKCNGVHQAVGGKQSWRREGGGGGGGGGEAFGPSSPLSHVPKKTGRHLSKLSSKITFKPPKWGTLSCVLWPNGGSVAIDIAVSKGQHQVFPIRLEKATGRLCGLQWLWQACHTTQFTELHNSIQIYENTCSTGIKNKTLNNRSTNYKFRSTERSLNNAFLLNVDDVVV